MMDPERRQHVANCCSLQLQTGKIGKSPEVPDWHSSELEGKQII